MRPCRSLARQLQYSILRPSHTPRANIRTPLGTQRSQQLRCFHQVSTKRYEIEPPYTQIDIDNILSKINHPPINLTPSLRKEYDDIENSLDNYLLKPNAPWGFVVFRTHYSEDTDKPFAQLLHVLRDSVTWSLKHADQMDLLPRHELTVIEDAAKLHGADSHTVRDAFREWIASGLPSHLTSSAIEQHGTADDMLNAEPPSRIMSFPARWNFCLFVDEACLRAKNPTVMILTLDWKGERAVKVAEGWADGETDDDMEDVGWMYLDALECVDFYNELVGLGDHWMDCGYQRPQKGWIRD
jgi:hypothetical protein